MSDYQSLRAGFAEVEFTPEPGLALLGQMRERRAEYARDPLMACAAAFQSAGETVVLVSVDVALLPDVFVREMKAQFALRTGLPAGHLLLHATHTHVAPAVVALMAVAPDPAFVARLQEAILQAAEGALARLEPVALFAGTGHMEQMGWNRRAMFEDGTSRMYGHAGMPGFMGMEGPRDPALGVLCARDHEGRTRGLLVNFASHPNAIEGASVYSADFPGEARRVLKQLLGPDTGVVYLTGAAGNTAPSLLDPHAPEQPWRGEAGLARSGLYLAGETMKVIAASLYPISDTTLRLEHQTLAIPLRPWPAPGDPTYPLPLTGDTPSPARDYYERAAAEWPRRLEEESAVPVSLDVLRIGDAALCTNPGELFVEYGLQIREGSPARVTLISELTDGYAGYVPTALAFERGGYETWPAPTSQLAPEAGPRIVDATRELLGRAFGS